MCKNILFSLIINIYIIYIMSFPSDTSTQLNYTTTSYLPTYSPITNPSILFNDGTSGIYNSTANSIIMYTSSTTAFTIETNQCLYGYAAGLTHLQYTNLDGKPSYFPADYNSTVINTPNLSVYATNTNLNSLSINNLNTTSTTILGNLNSLSTTSILSINNIIESSATILGNLNSLSTNSTLSINNLNATSTTSVSNLNSLSTQSYLDIPNIKATSTTISCNLNSLSADPHYHLII